MRHVLKFAPIALAPLLMAAAPAAQGPSTMPPAKYQQLAHDALAEIIAVHSVHAVGTVDVAKLIVARLEAGGFSDQEITVLADPKFPNQANVVVRLKGKGKGKPILWNGHMDVVEALPQDWTVPPFQMIEKDGYWYGRGTTDMKGDDVDMMVALIRLKQERFVPDRDIIIAFTADEEVGLDQDGAWWLMREHRDLIDAAYAIDTDGTSGEIDAGKRIALDLQTSEKTYVTLSLEVTNKGGHSSEPRPDNAIYTLAAGLTRVGAYQFPYKINATTKLYFQREAALQTGQVKADMLALTGDTPDLAAAARLAQDPSLNAILHTTCVATMLAAGHQENALPQRAQATIQCRIMPDETPEGTRQAILAAAADPLITARIPDQVVSAPESPPTPALIAKVQKVTDSMWPNVPVIPTMSAGASDGIFFRMGGIPTYGVSGLFGDIHDGRMHGRDERVNIQAFYESVEFTYRLMKETSKAD